MVKRTLLISLLLSAMVACSKQNTPPAKENVEQALKQNGMAGVNVDEDRDKGVITLKGDVQSEDQKQQAARAAQQAAPGKVVANELAVRPTGMESTASKVDSNTDDAIED